MRNIEKIFLRDVLALLKNPLALLIAVGLCFIPSLYAWFNIYSNWDPYSNTGAITIALASEDKGVTVDGKLVNVSDEVIEEMLSKTSINYIRVEDSETARNGVTAGDYYAAVVFDEDFTECMLEGFLNGMKRPHATYYENEKRNAVATKITDSAVSSLEDTVNKKYIVMVVTELFSRGKSGSEAIAEKNLTENLSLKLASALEMINGAKTLINSFEAANERLISAMDSAKGDLSAISDNVGRLTTETAEVRDKTENSDIAKNLNALNAGVLVKLGDTLDAVHRAENEDVAEQKSILYSEAAGKAGMAKQDVDAMIDALQFINSPVLANSRNVLLSTLSGASARLGTIKRDMEEASANAEDPDRLARTGAAVQAAVSMLRDDFSNVTVSGISNLSTAISGATEDIDAIAGHTIEDIELLYDIIKNGKKTVKLLNSSVSSLTDRLSLAEQELDEIDNVIAVIDDMELAEKFSKALEGDPEDYGEYFSHPIGIQDMPVYAVENYGSGVAPFYTTLAIWVGGVVLVSLLKVHADKKGLVNVKDHQLYFGRFLLFMVLGLVQTALIIWGDLYLLGIQCLYPGKFLLAGLAASVTFMLLIYSFTIAFGDIGKAAVVVIMVLQIAGSSGTYPIEILPEFYRQVYIFFPFPYAINAMREAIAGTYESDFTIYLLQLSLFAGAALVLGLFIRKPFKKVLHFMEKRMEDTDMM